MNTRQFTHYTKGSITNDAKGNHFEYRYWLLDTQWGCGGIVSVDGVVTETAPIFQRFKGARIKDLEKMYKLEAI